MSAALLVGAVTFVSAPQLTAVWDNAKSTPAETEARETSVYFHNCDAARAAGAAPIYRGQPGYRPEMDGDDDGIACEPYR